MSIRQLQLENCEAISQMGYDLSELIQMPKGLGSCYPMCSFRSVRDKLIVSINLFLQQKVITLKTSLKEVLPFSA